MDGHKNDCIVIIPTYNEKDNIADIIHAVFGLPEKMDILIIDDNSPDGTADIVKGLMQIYPDNLHILERKGKLGLGTAYLTGFKWCTEHGYDYICEMDADFSHNPNDLVRLYQKCQESGVDMVVGSRYKSGVNVINWPIGRVLMSYYASAYVRFVTGLKIMDTTAGFKCYSKKVLSSMNLDKIKFKGYAFQIEMKFTVWKMGFHIEEIPIIFTDRKKGKSKMSGGIFNEALWGVLKMKFRSFFRDYKKASPLI
jgi:dolichol-phosphate mannosyltransferase